MILRKKLIAGNWKMNKTPSDGVALVTELVAAIGKQTDVDVVVCPPFTGLESVGKALEGSNLKLGAQNMHFEASGAFTGEISAPMLRAFSDARHPRSQRAAHPTSASRTASSTRRCSPRSRTSCADPLRRRDARRA
jgi:hypothetical protein